MERHRIWGIGEIGKRRWVTLMIVEKTCCRFESCIPYRTRCDNKNDGRITLIGCPYLYATGRTWLNNN